MNKKIVMLAFVAVLATACGKKEETASAPAKPGATTAAAPAAAPLAVPASDDSNAWKQYLVQVAKANMGGIRSSPFMYYLPSQSVENFQEQYDRQLENVTAGIARGVLPGNMLAFGSPESGKLGDLIVEAFKAAQPASMKGVRVLFIGSKEDQERVKAAIEPSGAEVVLHAID